MKRLFALSTAILLTLSCFTGCEKSKEDLDETAQTLYKAANSALTEMDEDGIYAGGWYYFTSDGTYGGDSDNDIYNNTEIFTEKIQNYYASFNDTEWVISVDNYNVLELYVAENYEAFTVGVYPSDVEVNKNLSEIKLELEEQYELILEEREERKREEAQKAEEEASRAAAIEEEQAKNTVIDILNNTKVHHSFASTIGEIATVCFYDYELIIEKKDTNQYIATISGSYCPNPTLSINLSYDGYISYLVNIETGECEIYDDTGVAEAFYLYIVEGY